MDMTTIGGSAPARPVRPPGTGVRWTAGAAAAWCIGFAVVNVVMELAGFFDDGPLAAWTTGLAIASWLVVGLKLLGAATAALTVAQRPRWVQAGARTTLVWGAFALLALYSTGNLVQLARMLVTGSPAITAWSLAYIAFFVVGAVAYGVLAVSWSRRAGRDVRHAVAGAVGAPVLLGLLLGVMPAVLAAAGLLPG